jgi:hypothetical protein
MSKPTVFIGSSLEGLEVARAIQSELGRDAACNVWDQGMFRPGSYTLEVLQRQATSRDFAILVLTPDVLQASRNQTSFSPRPNVLFELGLFMGKLGRERVFVVQSQENRIEQPSDLHGLTVLEYDSRSSDGLQSAVAPSCYHIRQAIKAIGPCAASPLLLDRHNVYSAVGSFENRVASAQEEIWFSGFDCKYAILGHTRALEAALSRGVRIKIMCLDPEQPPTVNLLRSIRGLYLSDDDLRESMSAIQPLLCAWHREHKERFEFRYLPVLPVVGMFISDPDRDGIMKIELYTHEQRYGDVGDVSRPHLIIPPAISAWRKYFLKQWDLYWNYSRKPHEGIAVSAEVNSEAELISA